jgi:hypothetical protein
VTRLGVDRTNSGYVWPEALVRPSTDVRLVYLDLNHWIGLAKANTGHPDGHRYGDALAALRQAKSSGRFVFPLSGTHYMEMAGITSSRQRADVATVMEELSGFASLLTLSLLMRLELESSIDLAVGPRPVSYLPVPLLGRGVGPAFGLRGGLRFRSADGDVTDKQRAEWPEGPDAFDSMLADLNVRLERGMLRGPNDTEAAGLRGQGWDPTVARKSAEERAVGEREQAARFDAEPQWRRARVRDVVSVRYLIFEVMEMLQEALAARGFELEDVVGDPDSARRFVDAMPSADVYVSLKTTAHRNPETRWTANTILDIDALSVAVPYCDVVATDRAACHALRASGVAALLATEVVAKPSELVTQLKQ